MTNNALIAALGPDAVDAVNGYRLAVLAEAERRRLCLVAEAVPVDAAVAPGGIAGFRAIDIRLAFVYCRGRPDLAGRTLRWGPEQGWSMSHRLANRPLCYYARSVPNRRSSCPAHRSCSIGPLPIRAAAHAHRPPAGSTTTRTRSTACCALSIRSSASRQVWRQTAHMWRSDGTLVPRPEGAGCDRARPQRPGPGTRRSLRHRRPRQSDAGSGYRCRCGTSAGWSAPC